MKNDLEKKVMRKVTLRIIPFIMLLYFIAFLDRVNIGFAALTMNQDLGFSPTVFGLGAGIFFLGYFLFEVPSNLILHKVGARIWIAVGPFSFQPGEVAKIILAIFFAAYLVQTRDALSLVGKRAHGVAVVVEEGRPVGIIAERDCVEVDRYATVGEVMSREVLTVEAGADLR